MSEAQLEEDNVKSVLLDVHAPSDMTLMCEKSVYATYVVGYVKATPWYCQVNVGGSWTCEGVA